jgi:formate hydrogenlyase subunit 3/multisubunit Na+/H+ antiporter MnhD subunit
MTISMSLPFILPSLIGCYALSEVLFYRFFSSVNHWRKTVHLLLIALSGIYFVLSLNSVSQNPILFTIDGIFGVGLSFKLELLNLNLILLTTFVFFSITLYQFSNYENTSHERSFSWFFILTYVSAIGALLSNDLMAFFLFFEIVTFTTYGLIVRERDKNPKVLKVGFMYITMGVFGGLLILSGIIVLYAFTGAFSWDALALLYLETNNQAYFVSILFILGFLIKSAAVPFHFWLVRLYNETPYSINALSSGILTKLSAFGLLKVITLIYFVSNNRIGDMTPILSSIKWLGLGLIVIAALTMLVGVGLALVEEDMRKMLTYHSISQMGYILLGIGIAAYLGEKGALGLSGSLYHMVNHALFKSALFMSAGILYNITKEHSMYMMGGILKKSPLLGLLTLVPVLGITGMVGFNGYASKALIHHAVTESIQYGHPAFIVLEVVFILVSAGTVTSFLKFYWFIFINAIPTHIKKLDFKPQIAWFALVINAILILLIGIFPNFLITEFYGPITLNTYYNIDFVNKYLIQLDYFSLLEIRGMLGILILGSSMFYLGIRFDLFHQHLPHWLSAENLFFQPIEWLFDRLPNQIVQQNEHRIIRADIFVYAILLTFLVIVLVISLI